MSETARTDRCLWCHATEGLATVKYPPNVKVTECTDKTACNERWLKAGLQKP